MYIERKRICEMENRSNGSSENYKGGRGKRRRPTHARTRGQTGEAREGIENGAGEGEDGGSSEEQNEMLRAAEAPPRRRRAGRRNKTKSPEDKRRGDEKK